MTLKPAKVNRDNSILDRDYYIMCFNGRWLLYSTERKEACHD